MSVLLIRFKRQVLQVATAEATNSKSMLKVSLCIKALSLVAVYNKHIHSEYFLNHTRKWFVNEVCVKMKMKLLHNISV